MATNYPVIAVIDDDLSVLKAMGRVLLLHGFASELYSSPDNFLDAIATTQASCLVVDIQLGDSCGIEFVCELIKRGIKLPVIFMTGNDNEEVKRRALETGCVAFFSKPCSAYLLIEALYRLADSWRPSSQVMTH